MEPKGWSYLILSLFVRQKQQWRWLTTQFISYCSLIPPLLLVSLLLWQSGTWQHQPTKTCSWPFVNRKNKFSDLLQCGKVFGGEQGEQGSKIWGWATAALLASFSCLSWPCFTRNRADLLWSVCWLWMIWLCYSAFSIQCNRGSFFIWGQWVLVLDRFLQFRDENLSSLFISTPLTAASVKPLVSTGSCLHCSLFILLVMTFWCSWLHWSS